MAIEEFSAIRRSLSRSLVTECCSEHVENLDHKDTKVHEGNLKLRLSAGRLSCEAASYAIILLSFTS